MERVVNIIGMGMSADDTPDTGENWGINLAYKFAKLDKLFFMDHLNEVLGHDHILRPEKQFKDFLKESPNAEMISKYAEDITDIQTKEVIGKIKQYPLDKALTLSKCGYFTSTVAYVICYAILEKVDRIRLYGMEMWSGSDANEYEVQKPCIDFWLAFAIGRGIKVEVPYLLIHTANNKQNFYGFAFGELFQNRTKLGGN